MPRREFKTKFPEIIVCVDGVDYRVSGITMDMYQELKSVGDDDADPERIRKQIKMILPSMTDETIGTLEVGMILEIINWSVEQITGAYTQLTDAEKNELRPADVQSEK